MQRWWQEEKCDAQIVTHLVQFGLSRSGCRPDGSANSVCGSVVVKHFNDVPWFKAPHTVCRNMRDFMETWNRLTSLLLHLPGKQNLILCVNLKVWGWRRPFSDQNTGWKTGYLWFDCRHGRTLSLLQSISTTCSVQPASYSTDTKRSFSGVKRPKRDVNYVLSSAIVKNVWSYNSAPNIHVLVFVHDI